MAIVDADILVVGGGPAGLLAASYLSKRHRVIVIEREIFGETTKFWVATERRLKRHGLEKCILHRARTMIMGSFLGSRASASGDFAVVDEEHLLRSLVKRCKENGATLVENSRLLNLRWTAQSLFAEAGGTEYRVRLVLDAMGGASSIASTFRLHHIGGFYCVYGGFLRDIKLHSPEIVLAYVGQLGNPPPVFEIIPTGTDSAYAVVFVYTQNLVDPRSLARTFEEHCEHNPFFTLTPETRRLKEKSGAIAIGQTRRRKLRGVVAMGEAGLVQPPLMGTAFNEALEHTEAICRRISRVLEDTSGIFDARIQLYPVLKRVQDHLQLGIAKRLMSGDVETFDRTVRAVATLSEPLAFSFLSNELTWGELGGLLVRLPWHFVASATSFNGMTRH